MNLKMIVATDKRNGIGLNNSIPWYRREDMKHFSKTTKGNGNNAIIMGKNTWLSLPKKPLPQRDNIILSTTEKWNGNRIKTYSDIDELKRECMNNNYEEIWIIGGQKIYELFINDPDLCEIYISKVQGNFNCDTFFPTIPNIFNCTSSGFLDTDVVLEIYSRKNNSNS